MANNSKTAEITYADEIKEKRKKFFKTPKELVYDIFISNGYGEKDEKYFLENASEIIEKLREECWTAYKKEEEKFTLQILLDLVESDEANECSVEDFIKDYIGKNLSKIYDLCLSNTNSRRSRSGKEFEAEFELVLAGAGINFDSQGLVGGNLFKTKELSKLVDFVLPGVDYYVIDHSDSILLSAKTTLRERWQEVPEEKDRSGAASIYLLTLDEDISEQTSDKLYTQHVMVVTTKNNIKKNYMEYPSYKSRFICLEDFIELCSAREKDCMSKVEMNKERLTEIELGLKNLKYSTDSPFWDKYYTTCIKKIDSKFDENTDPENPVNAICEKRKQLAEKNEKLSELQEKKKNQKTIIKNKEVIYNKQKRYFETLAIQTENDKQELLDTESLYKVNVQKGNEIDIEIDLNKKYRQTLIKQIKKYETLLKQRKK